MALRSLLRKMPALGLRTAMAPRMPLSPAALMSQGPTHLPPAAGEQIIYREGMLTRKQHTINRMNSGFRNGAEYNKNVAEYKKDEEIIRKQRAKLRELIRHDSVNFRKSLDEIEKRWNIFAYSIYAVAGLVVIRSSLMS